MYEYYNPNPMNKKVGDCVIRAISKMLRQSWVRTYVGICIKGLLMADMPSSNSVWGAYLYEKGYDRYAIASTRPDRYTVRDFCFDHPYGEYVLATGSHVVAVINGKYYDAWDSGDESPIYFWSS